MLIVELVNNENDADAKKDEKQLEKIMLSSDEWELLQQLIITFGSLKKQQIILIEKNILLIVL